MSSRPGDVIVAREAVWQVLAIESGAGCRALTLRRLHPSPRGLTRTLIEPFDAFRPVSGGRGLADPTVVSPRAAARATRGLLLQNRRWCEPASAAGSRVELLPWQFVPALALLTGTARRVLAADAVGLGKTVQAGLLVRELLDRSPAARLLVLVPAGLRSQWRDELARRFDITADVADLDWLARQARSLPLDVNPWSRPRLVITSLDFAKRDEVLPGPERLAWDLVIVDEAHALGAGTARAALAEAVCRRARSVLLLTATPHDGHQARFDALCRIGAIPGEPPLLVVRRLRQDVTAARARRRWRVVRTGSTDDELHLQRLIEHYLARLEHQTVVSTEPQAIQLLVQVLRKRAASGAWALARTLTRRRVLLAGRAAVLRQAALPFSPDPMTDDMDAPDDLLGIAGLTNGHAERAWLGALVEAARRAARHDSKLAALTRRMHRIHEPVLVFTEYRDSLDHLARALGQSGPVELLHGGLSAAERAGTVRRFTSGQARALLATDAASEGLNLHDRCRVVILWDLPWTPTRLEQRIGRLDRMGQSRRVHAVVLMRRQDRFEESLLRQLEARRDRIDDALSTGADRASIAPLRDDADGIVRELRLRRRVLLADRNDRPRWTSDSPWETVQDGWSANPHGHPIVTCLAPPRDREGWSGVLAIVDAQLDCGTALVDRAVVAMQVPVPVPRLRSPADVRQYLAGQPGFQAILLRHAHASVEARWQRSREDWSRFVRVTDRADTAAAIADRHVESHLVQPSLFGRYARADRRDTGSDGGPGRSAGVSDTTPGGVDPGGGSVLSERLTLAVVFLRPGPGQVSAPGGA